MRKPSRSQGTWMSKREECFRKRAEDVPEIASAIALRHVQGFAAGMKGSIEPCFIIVLLLGAKVLKHFHDVS